MPQMCTTNNPTCVTLDPETKGETYIHWDGERLSPTFGKVPTAPVTPPKTPDSVRRPGLTSTTGPRGRVVTRRGTEDPSSLGRGRTTGGEWTRDVSRRGRDSYGGHGKSHSDLVFPEKYKSKLYSKNLSDHFFHCGKTRG